MTEMLLQSHRIGEDGQPIIHLLPALPVAWPIGSVKGLRARGAFLVDIEWEDGTLRRATFESLKGTPLAVFHDGNVTQTATEAGRAYRFDGEKLK